MELMNPENNKITGTGNARMDAVLTQKALEFPGKFLYNQFSCYKSSKFLLLLPLHNRYFTNLPLLNLKREQSRRIKNRKRFQERTSRSQFPIIRFTCAKIKNNLGPHVFVPHRSLIRRIYHHPIQNNWAVRRRP